MTKDMVKPLEEAWQRRRTDATKSFHQLLRKMDGAQTAAAFKALRIVRGCSVEDLAREWKMKPERIRRWEAGQRKRIHNIDFSR